MPGRAIRPWPIWSWGAPIHGRIAAGTTVGASCFSRKQGAPHTSCSRPCHADRGRLANSPSEPDTATEVEMRGLKGKVAIVTGGGSGLGEAIGKALASRGVKVVLSDINLKGAER